MYRELVQSSGYACYYWNKREIPLGIADVHTIVKFGNIYKRQTDTDA